MSLCVLFDTRVAGTGRAMRFILAVAVVRRFVL